MLQWLATNWKWLIAGIVLGGYFACYVLALRHQRAAGGSGKPRLPGDRC